MLIFIEPKEQVVSYILQRHAWEFVVNIALIFEHNTSKSRYFNRIKQSWNYFNREVSLKCDISRYKKFLKELKQKFNSLIIIAMIIVLG